MGRWFFLRLTRDDGGQGKVKSLGTTAPTMRLGDQNCPPRLSAVIGQF